MAAIVSPRPRAARSSRRPSSSRPVPPSPYTAQDGSARVNVSSHPHRRTRHNPARLMSPIDLFDPRANASHSSNPCSPAKKRRGPTFNPVRSPRRRHCLRADCPISPLSGPAFFDRLPWIQQLEASPEDVSVFDTADLSLLTEELSQPQSPSIGPIRRRKHSLHSSPLSAPSIERERDLFIAPAFHELPVYSLLPPDRIPSSPRTPPPRELFLPDEVQFHGLHPSFPLGLDDAWRRPDIDSPY